MKPIFKHSVKDAFLVTQTLVLLGIAYALSIADLGLFWNLLIAPFHILIVLNSQNSTLHHHCHWTTFSRKSWNSVYDLLVAAGHYNKVQTYRVVHNIHHKYVNDLPVNGVTKDPISVFNGGKNGELENVWKFCFRWALLQISDPWKYLFLESWKFERKKLPLYNYALWRREQFAVIAFISSIMIINFWYSIWLMFIIYFPAFFLSYAWHYGDHYGSYQHRGDATRDSVGIYNKWYNLISSNTGYHQEHHYKPQIHWANLPTITPLLPPDRRIIDSMHITNVPWLEHLKLLFKL